MEYRKKMKEPVTKKERTARRRRERPLQARKSDETRRRSARQGQPDELGVLHGQNGEEVATVDPNLAKASGRSAH